VEKLYEKGKIRSEEIREIFGEDIEDSVRLGMKDLGVVVLE
jgi:hypothetical protein